MAGKKAHKPRNVPGAGLHGVHPQRTADKSAGQTRGQFERDTKHRQGQYGGAGNPPLVKK